MQPSHTPHNNSEDKQNNHTPQDGKLKTHKLARRRFLQATTVSSVLIPTAFHSSFSSSLPKTSAQPANQELTAIDSTSVGFLHSVASGDPLPDGIIIWSRLTPEADATPGSGRGVPTKVRWEISPTPNFSSIIQSGIFQTNPHSDHTIKVDVRGLQPAQTYFYRFLSLDGPSQGSVSVTGRTRTAPSDTSTPTNIRFGVASCANYEAGYFLGYRDLARRNDIEFVLHLGDYTYEYPTGRYGGLYDTIVRKTQPAQRTTTLSDYRIRQGWYHQDPDLAALHAAKPMICMWDDHEFADNVYGSGIGGNSAEAQDDFEAIKAAATQAYYEWMPVRTAGMKNDLSDHLYRHIRYGQLFEIILPDLRSYRDINLVQYGKANRSRTNLDFLREAGNDNRSMMGKNQFTWFQSVLSSSTSQWQIIGNSVMFAPLTLPTDIDPTLHSWLVQQLGIPDQGLPLNTDQWDGYMAERQKIIDLLLADKTKNAVFLTGDIHSSWANNIPADIYQYRLGSNKASVAAEFVAPSITASSGYDSMVSSPDKEKLMGTILKAGEKALSIGDPWFQWVDLRYHGYMVVDINSQRVQADWHHVPTVLHNDGQFTLAKSAITRPDNPGIQFISQPLDQSKTVY